MAIVRRGNRAGERVKIMGYANDWFSVDFEDGKTAIIKPLNIILDEVEREHWLDNPARMDREFALREDGTFVRLGRNVRQVR